MGKVVTKPRGKHTGLKPWKVVYEYGFWDYPKGYPLTKKSVNHWRRTKNAVGYALFNGLAVRDIKGVLSAIKEGKGHLNVNRMGEIAFYKLNL
jgi:hypothetical protein